MIWRNTFPLADDGPVELTYAEVGGTRAGAEPPAGYRHVRRGVFVGHGVPVFAAARAGLAQWRVFQAAGLATRASAPAAAPDVEISNGLGVGPLRLWVPCRVVWLVDEPRRYGYAIGTLPGHPESGEEAFELTADERGSVWFEVRAFSRPATWYSRLGGPVTHALQDWMTGRYLRGLCRLALPGGGSDQAVSGGLGGW